MPIKKCKWPEAYLSSLLNLTFLYSLKREEIITIDCKGMVIEVKCTIHDKNV